MKNRFLKISLFVGVVSVGLIGCPEIPFWDSCFITDAEARFGRPATPVSYAGVARRTTVRVATPGAGAPGAGVTPGVGVGAPGRGVTPGVGAGAPGAGARPGNAGGPENRVGVR